jgi:hypothetical protein
MKLEQKIYFEISGGLGNQLFMLCAGIFLQKKLKRSVCFDISDLARISYLHPGHNVFTLGLLDGYEVINSKKKYVNLNKIRKKLIRICDGVFEVWRDRELRKTLSVSEIGYIDLNNIPINSKRINGYFQSWRYFSQINENIFSKIESTIKPSNWYLNEQKILNQKSFAAFHIRRGDYKLAINRPTGILSLTYFDKIVDLLPVGLEILIFTDAVEEIKMELVGIRKGFRIMEPSSDSDPIESLLLMSRASHIAISNSTYSWWAASFAAPGSVIYAPTKWFEQRQDPIDLIPDNWVRIQSEWEFQE